MKKLFLLFAAVTLFISLQAFKPKGKVAKKPVVNYTLDTICLQMDTIRYVNGVKVIKRGVKIPAPCVGCP